MTDRDQLCQSNLYAFPLEMSSSNITSIFIAKADDTQLYVVFWLYIPSGQLFFITVF